MWPSRASDGDEVELTFASTELRGICESRRRAISAIGVHAARELEQMLADLAALPTFADLPELFVVQAVFECKQRKIRTGPG